MNNPVQNTRAARLVLASKSPVRAALLRQAGLDFTVCAATVDERTLEAETDSGPKRLAGHLAAAKGLALAPGYPDALIIAADQTLDHQGAILHKPASMAAATEQLKRLRGDTHALHSAVCLVKDDAVLWTHTQTAELTMRDFSDAECADILAREGDAVLQSVGAYRLEGPSVRLFSDIQGDYFTILGLPLLALLDALREFAPESM